MKFILGQKIEMSEVFSEDGTVTPVTVVRATPNVVLQVKTKKKDGYEAVQIGTGEKKEKNVKKPQKGHFKNLGNFRFMKEFKSEGDAKFEIGQKIDASVFQEGDDVAVIGTSKGKGFQGVVKRHGFHGGPRTHGQKHSEREAGSIGSTGPQKVLKGTRMAGRMGGCRVTIKNLKIVKVDKENNLLAISGAIPGARGSLVEIRSR